MIPTHGFEINVVYMVVAVVLFVGTLAVMEILDRLTKTPGARHIDFADMQSLLCTLFVAFVTFLLYLFMPTSRPPEGLPNTILYAFHVRNFGGYLAMGFYLVARWRNARKAMRRLDEERSARNVASQIVDGPDHFLLSQRDKERQTPTRH